MTTCCINSNGYGAIGWGEDGRSHITNAHRAAWVHFHGPIPAGMTVDHLCKNRPCVNVEHLRLLSRADNAARTYGRDWPLGECVNGHPDTERARYKFNGRSYCRVCRREWVRKCHERDPDYHKRYHQERKRRKLEA